MKKKWITTAHQGFVTEGMCSNTLSAFALAAKKGADFIETDARECSDGVLICNHDPLIHGYNEKLERIDVEIDSAEYSDIAKIILAPNDKAGIQYVPTLEQTLHLAYWTGLCVNIDLKEGFKSAEKIASMVCRYGMAGRVVYAPNGSGEETMLAILKIDPDARFIDRPWNFSADNLKNIPDYRKRCFAFTSNFSQDNIDSIRESGCKLATISLNENNIRAAFAHHPDMAEYPHTSDFEKLEKLLGYDIG